MTDKSIDFFAPVLAFVFPELHRLGHAAAAIVKLHPHLHRIRGRRKCFLLVGRNVLHLQLKASVGRFLHFHAFGKPHRGPVGDISQAPLLVDYVSGSQIRNKHKFGVSLDKLFLQVAGRPIVAHTWARFNRAACIDEIVLVVRDTMQPAFVELAEEFRFNKPYRLVVGGKERQDSVWNGLQALDTGAEVVAIQDGARPCTTEKLIADTIQAAQETGAAAASQRVTDTIKESDGGTLIARTVDRSRLWAVQTPQSFRVEVIRRALAAVKEKGLIVTDDTAACEQIGQAVKLVESAMPNPNVTRPGDLAYVESLLRQAE